MSKRVKLFGVDEDEDQDLRGFLENYIKKSEELQKRESKVLKQVELIQSAVASLQAWNESRRASASTFKSVNIDLREIEEESKKIKEETEIIQKEVRQKIEENKKLQDEVNRKKEMRGKREEFANLIDEEERIGRIEKEDIEFRERTENELSELTLNSDSGIQFFNEKLEKLKEMEKKLKRESELELEEARNKKKSGHEKPEWPKWESKADEQLIDTWKKKIGSN